MQSHPDSLDAYAGEWTHFRMALLQQVLADLSLLLNRRLKSHAKVGTIDLLVHAGDGRTIHADRRQLTHESAYQGNPLAQLHRYPIRISIFHLLHQLLHIRCLTVFLHGDRNDSLPTC